MPQSLKDRIYAPTGIRHHRSYQYEIDLVSLELGGTNDRSNLWPGGVRGRRGARQKDVVENGLHRRVCARRVTLRSGRRFMAGDWRTALQ